jgi:hypothetical protein
MTRTFSLLAAGKFQEGRDAMHAALARYEALDDVFYIALASGALSAVSAGFGDVAGSIRLSMRCVTLQYAMGDMASTTLSLRAVAVILLTAGLPHEGATMFGRYEALCRRHGFRPPIDPEGWVLLGWSGDRLAAAVEAYGEERRRGAEMTTDEALALAARMAESLQGEPAGIPGG